MTDKKSNDSRRKLLKSIAAGSGAVVAGKSLPESWSKPVINSVMLPAHAETTDDTDAGGTTAIPLTYSCSVTGPETINAGFFGAEGPFEYIVKNTGTGTLTGADVITTATDGTGTGLISTSTYNDGDGVPLTLAPGQEFPITVTGVNIDECNGPTGYATLTQEFTSNESSCKQVTTVNCQEFQ